MQVLMALIGGLLFGTGLTVSGMVNPEKILAFLDLGAIPSGGWDPTLAFVMIGALVVSAPAYHWAKTHHKALAGCDISIPKSRQIDRSLILGAVLFGAGWGLGGYCPGPAISGLAFGYWQTALLVVSMLAGMLFFRLTREK